MSVAIRTSYMYVESPGISVYVCLWFTTQLCHTGGPCQVNSIFPCGSLDLIVKFCAAAQLNIPDDRQADVCPVKEIPGRLPFPGN